MSDKKYKFFSIAKRVIPLYFKSSPILASIEQVLSTIHGLSWVLTIIATQILFDSITLAGAGEIGFSQVIIPLILLGAVTFGQQLFNGVANFTAEQVSEKNMGKYWVAMQKKLQRIPAIRFEEADFLDDIEKAKAGVDFLDYFTGVCMLFFTFYGIYFIGVGAYLFWLSPILPLVLLAAFLPALFSQVMRVKIFTKLEQENAPLRRKHEYYQKVIVDREFFKETRILGAYHFFHRLFSETLLIVSEKTLKTERKATLLQFVLNIASFFGLGGASFLLFNSTMNGTITVGAFAAVFTSLNTIFWLMDELITGHLSTMNNNVGKVANYVRLLDMAEEERKPGIADFAQGIVAQNISFTYPNREESAIRNVSLTIAKGETIAIVGENGAGKSTLVRLLTGLYKPSGGTVLIGGLDSKVAKITGTFKGVSAVFQRYQRYKMALSENVSISDTSSASDEAKILEALKGSEFNEKSVNLDTILSPEFDGIDLSGGQWQRIAIARGLYRINDFIILDEPTASIDPIEETRIYNQFKELSKDKCAIIVTHRLSSTKLADKIIVLDDGRIVESGTCDELLNHSGKYADMWRVQAEWYNRIE